MVKMEGLTIQELADLYDASTPDVKQWMHDNIHLWKEKTIIQCLQNLISLLKHKKFSYF